MFTNWLTSPTTPSSSSSSLTTITGNGNLLGQLPTNLMATPPDIILEVGPSPTVRFVAHSTLLAMHSGYLRSAIRIDENLLISGNSTSGDLHNHHNNNNNNNSGIIDFPPIFLTNVTPEQFGPLLTYMYTGYLDLTLENIFGVLLATHVLHMPRALEICRAFLSRSQSEGYLNSGFINQIENNNNNMKNGCKIIRPIASKPIIPNLGFIVPPQIQNISLTSSTSTPFRSLNNSINHISDDKQQSQSPKLQKLTNNNNNNLSLSPSTIKLSKLSPTPKDNQQQQQQQNHIKRSPKLKRISSSSSLDKSRTKISTSTSSSLLSKETIQLASINHDNENKIIIDVASCDGPVRFRRVLNDSYGRQPDSVHLPTPQSERNHQSLSYSFHQQMAKNIVCQQRQQQQQQQQQQNFHNHSEESENSEDLRNCNGQLNQNCSNNSGGGGGSGGSGSISGAGGNDVYNCVYCKHTFKSQYCYQKHAKRHLNPLSLEHGEGIILAPSITTFGELTKDEKIISRTAIVTTSSNNIKNINSISTICSTTVSDPTTNENGKNNHKNNGNYIIKSSTRASNSNNVNNNNNNSTTTNNTGTSITTLDGGKREVRPLDMNVQYYPCKTCGSKFPSYYFVHKHRKMCHANEEN